VVFWIFLSNLIFLVVSGFEFFVQIWILFWFENFEIRNVFKFIFCSNFKFVQIQILFIYENCSKKSFKYEICSNSKIVRIWFLVQI
jgi:hypothetical protein